MGIFLDTVEDNDESSGWRIESLRKKLGILPSPPLRFPTVTCPLCHQGFFSHIELQNHIFQVHKDHRCYIRLNDRILRKDIYLKEKIQRLEVYSTDPHAFLSLQLNTNPSVDIQLSSTQINLFERISPDFTGELKLLLKDSSGQEQHITCYCHTLPELDYSDLDKITLELQSKVNKGDRYINWNKYKLLRDRDKDQLRHQYLSGMLEYFWAHDQEVNHYSISCHSSVSRSFENADGYLEPFTSYLAQQIRRVIALKMNWFTELQEASESSLFFLAWHFFKHDYESVSSVRLPLPNKQLSQGILLDNFHEGILDALKLYYCDRDALSNGSLIKLETLLQGTTNSNYQDKLTLLKARLFREWGDVHRAKQAYRSIEHHRLFEAEARTFNV